MFPESGAKSHTGGGWSPKAVQVGLPIRAINRIDCKESPMTSMKKCTSRNSARAKDADGHYALRF